MFRLRLVFVMLMIFAFAVAGMPTAAQEGEEGGPARVGLRPDAPTYALHGPYWVGTREFIVNEGSDTAFPVVMWYPALNPDRAEEATTYVIDLESPARAYLPADWQEPLIIKGHAIAGAAPDTSAAPYPLVIISHGFTFPKLNMYLGEHLASYGFIVLAPDHLQDAWNVFYPSIVHRLLEVKQTIQYAETLKTDDGPFANVIDMEHIAVGGHSAGGITSYGAGGALLDWAPIEHYCTVEIPDDPACADLSNQQKGMLEAAGLDTMPEDLWPVLGDSRVDAVFPMAGTIEPYGTNGLVQLKVPILIMAGTADALTPWVYPAYEAVGSPIKLKVLFEDAGHFIFINSCDALPWATATGLFGLCSDPVWDLNRTNDLTNHFTTAFLLDVLKGDAEAHAALLPDAVSFPGITYETTMR